MPRSKLELPQKVIDTLKIMARNQETNPSAVIRQMIDQTTLQPADLQKGKINVSWGSDHDAMLLQLAGQVTIERNGKLYPATKLTILQAIIEKHLSELVPVAQENK